MHRPSVGIGWESQRLAPATDRHRPNRKVAGNPARHRIFSHTTVNCRFSDLAEVFSVSRSTIYRTLQRTSCRERLSQTERQSAAAKAAGKGHPVPIKPELRGFYPLDWPQLSHSIRFRRTKGRCKRCGRPHGETLHHLRDGRWYDREIDRWRDGKGKGLRTYLPSQLRSPCPAPISTTMSAPVAQATSPRSVRAAI